MSKSGADASVDAVDLRIDGAHGSHGWPAAIDHHRPTLRWALAGGRGAAPVGWEVHVGTAEGGAVGRLWSRRGRGTAPAGVTYGGPQFEPLTRYSWTVRVRSADGSWSQPAPPMTFVTGLLGGPWSAPWIARANVERKDSELQQAARFDAGDTWIGPAPLCIGTTVFLEQLPVAARAVVVARGIYELELNGRRVGNQRFRPGWVDYEQRLAYDVHVLDDVLMAGDNRLTVTVAGGWYSGRLAWLEGVYGDRPSVSVQVRVTFADGSTLVVDSDDTWEAQPTSIVWADLVMGEGRRTRPHASPIEVVATPAVALTLAAAPPVVELETIDGVAIVDEPGRTVLDFGANVVGVVRLELQSPADGTVVVRHAEMLEPSGALYTDNLRTARAVDAYEHRAGESVVLEPRFSVHGFRYAEVIRSAPSSVHARAIVLGSDVRPAGDFACSNELINRFVGNVRRSLRGNFLEVPTDTPARDERLGWTCDAQVFAPSACWLADVESFLTKWLTDLRDAQTSDGVFPDVAPLVAKDLLGNGAPGWADAGVLVPWTLYERYGTPAIIQASYSAMCRFVDQLARVNPDGLRLNGNGNNWGDWLAVGEETPPDLVATAYFARSAAIVAAASRVVGQPTAAAKYAGLARHVRRAFADAYVTRDGRLVCETEKADTLAIAFDLLARPARRAAGDWLVDRIESKRGAGSSFRPGHLATGFLGVGSLLGALTKVGRVDVAYRLMEETSYPSWLYPVTQGATTVWERWDAWTEEHGFQSRGMNSFNHYALGSACDWLFSGVAGLAPRRPGFDGVVIAPRPGGTLEWAEAEHRSVRGAIRSGWCKQADSVEYEISTPPGVTATIELPAAAGAVVEADTQRIDRASEVEVVGRGADSIRIRTAGGAFRFSVREPVAGVPTSEMA